MTSKNKHICENPLCQKEHDGSYGSGRFCSSHCRNSYAGLKSGQSKRNNAQKNKKEQKSQSAIKKNGKYICSFCFREFSSRFGYASHSSRCKLNPAYDESKVKTRYENQGKVWSNKCKNDPSKTWKGKHHTKETREKISVSRSKNISFDLKSGRRKDVKWYKVKNLNNEEFVVRGHWEENVAIKLNELGILWERNKQIPYFDGQIIRQYNPDFYLPNTNEYIEVKGYYPLEDQKKMKFVLDQHKNIVIFFIGENQYKKFLDGKLLLSECRLL